MSALNDTAFTPPSSPQALPVAPMEAMAPEWPAPPAKTSAEMLLCATRVQTFDGSQALTSASGFYFRTGGRLFLVTSRHVFFDGPSQHSPDRVEVICHSDAVDLTQVDRMTLPLYANRAARWRQGQDSGGAIDVAVLEIDAAQLPQPNAMQAFGPEHLACRQDAWEVGDALAIPGFPMGFHDLVHHLPVVRSASIASAYGVRFQGQGYFLTDGRTHRGSSGAPVLAHAADARGQRHWRLLGIHSSRMDMSGRDAALDESLGLNCAWYADVLVMLTRNTSG